MTGTDPFSPPPLLSVPSRAGEHNGAQTTTPSKAPAVRDYTLVPPSAVPAVEHPLHSLSTAAPVHDSAGGAASSPHMAVPTTHAPPVSNAFVYFPFPKDHSMSVRTAAASALDLQIAEAMTDISLAVPTPAASPCPSSPYGEEDDGVHGDGDDGRGDGSLENPDERNSSDGRGHRSSDSLKGCRPRLEMVIDHAGRGGKSPARAAGPYSRQGTVDASGRGVLKDSCSNWQTLNSCGMGARNPERGGTALGARRGRSHQDRNLAHRIRGSSADSGTAQSPSDDNGRFPDGWGDEAVRGRQAEGSGMCAVDQASQASAAGNAWRRGAGQSLVVGREHVGLEDGERQVAGALNASPSDGDASAPDDARTGESRTVETRAADGLGEGETGAWQGVLRATEAVRDCGDGNGVDSDSDHVDSVDERDSDGEGDHGRVTGARRAAGDGHDEDNDDNGEDMGGNSGLADENEGGGESDAEVTAGDHTVEAMGEASSGDGGETDMEAQHNEDSGGNDNSPQGEDNLGVQTVTSEPPVSTTGQQNVQTTTGAAEGPASGTGDRGRARVRRGLEDGDVDALMVRNGQDMQGIPWENLPFSREDYRAMRLKDQSRPRDGNEVADLRRVVREPQRGAKFYRFSCNTRRVKSSIVHFQLRNLVWATTNHDVFLMHEATVVHWDAAARRRTPVLDLSGNVAHGIGGTGGLLPGAGGNGNGNVVGAGDPGNGTPGTATGAGGGAGQVASLGSVQISTMIAKGEIVIAGGFFGEVVAKNLRTHVIEYNRRITYDENAITNAIDIYGTRVMSSNNDCFVRVFDLPTFAKVDEFRYAKAVNHATRQPNGKMVAVVGDDKPVYVMDGDSGQRIETLHGHEDFSFATAWHPDARLFATGSQDRTCRLWDVRNMSQSLCVMGAHVGAMRSLRFSGCGRFLAMAEPLDFVHIYDVVRGDFRHCQEIDLFGEIAGISLSPDADVLFIGMYDRNYGSLLEFERNAKAPSVMPDLLP